MSDIFVTRRWPGDALTKLNPVAAVRVWPDYDAPTHDQLVDAARNTSAIITTIEDPVDAAVLDAGGESLRIIAQAGVGFDNIDLNAAKQRGIWVTNAPGVLDECTADLAFALMMAVARRIPEAVEYVRKDKWSGWHPSLLTGAEFSGATIGIVGLGRIGMAFARRCEGFDMNVLYHTRTPKPDADERGYRHVPLDELLSTSDFVSLHVPLTAETKGLIGARELALMKQSAILVNTARGAVVDTDALIAAMKDSRIAGAGLDVTDPEPMRANHPLLDCPGVVILPHIGSAGIQTREKMFQLAVANVLAVLEDREPRNALVNPRS